MTMKSPRAELFFALASVTFLVALSIALAGCGRRSKRETVETTGASASASDGDLTAKPGTLSILVEVDRKKRDGRPWDVGSGPPDIALCATSDGETQCFPSGSSMEDVHVPKCRDAYRCTFSNLPLALEDLELEVFDVDLAENDDIGTGKAKRGTSRLGAARITLVGDGIDDKPFTADPAKLSALLANPSAATAATPAGDAGKASRTVSPRGITTVGVELPFCPHGVLESSKAKGAAAFRCEGWKGRWKKVGLGELDPLFSVDVTSPSGADEEHRWFEVKSGPLAGNYVQSTPNAWQVVSLAWVRSEKLAEIDPWLCENRSLLGYDRNKCAPAASATGSATAVPSARGR